MNKKNILLVYLLLMLLALPVAFFLTRTSQENRPSAAGEINLTVAPNTAQITNASDQVPAHFWINSGSIKLAFVRLSLEFDNTLEVVSISNFTDKLQTPVTSTSVSDANTTGKMVFTRALDTEHRNNPPTGALDFVTVTFKKKGETGVLTENNVRFKKTDLQIVDIDGNDWKDNSVKTKGAKYQTSVGNVTVTQTNTPTPTTAGPTATATVTNTKTPTPTPKVSPGPLTQIEVTGVVRKVSPCAEYFLCYELTNTSNGTNYYLFSKPIMKVMGPGFEKEPLDQPTLRILQRAMPDICIDEVVDEPNCKPVLPRITNFDQYVGKTVTIKGYTNVYKGKRFIAVSSIKVVSGSPTATKTPTPTATPTTPSTTPTPSLTPIPGADTTLGFLADKVEQPVDKQFTQYLTMDTGINQVSAVDITLRYDPSLLTLNSLETKSDVFPNVLVAPQIDNTNGIARITLGAGSALTGQKTIATFVATGKKTGTGILSYGSETKVSAFGNNQNVLKSLGKMDLVFNSTNGLKGDLDQNGKVDIFDYNILLENFGNTTCGNKADLDGNCKVDIFDYNILLENFGKTV